VIHHCWIASTANTAATMYHLLLRLAVHGVAPQQLFGTLIGRRAVLFAEFQTSMMHNWRRQPLICVKLALNCRQYLRAD